MTLEQLHPCIRSKRNPNSLLLSVKRRGDEGEQLAPVTRPLRFSIRVVVRSDASHVARGLRANRGSNDLVIRSDSLYLEGGARKGEARRGGGRAKEWNEACTTAQQSTGNEREGESRSERCSETSLSSVRKQAGSASVGTSSRGFGELLCPEGSFSAQHGFTADDAGSV